MVAVAGRCRPDGAEIHFDLGFYKYAAPDGAWVGTLRGDVPAGAFPLLASGISAGPPGTGKRGPADGAARHPYHGATPKTATGTGALPSQVPAGRPMAVWGGRTGQRAFESN